MSSVGSAVERPSSAEHPLPTFRQINPNAHRRIKRKTIVSSQAQSGITGYYDSDAGPSTGISSFIPLATRRESASNLRRQSGTFSVRDENGSYFTNGLTNGMSAKGKERERVRPLPRPPSLVYSTRSRGDRDSPTTSTGSPGLQASPSSIHTIATVNNHIAGNMKMRASWGRIQLRDPSKATSPRNSVHSAGSPHHTVDAFKMRAQWRNRLTQTPFPSHPASIRDSLASSRPLISLSPSAQSASFSSKEAVLSPKQELRSDTSWAKTGATGSVSPHQTQPVSPATDQFITVTTPSSQSPHRSSTSDSTGNERKGFGLDLMEFPAPPAELPVSPTGATFDMEAYKRRSMRGRAVSDDRERERKISEPCKKNRISDHGVNPEPSSGSTDYHSASTGLVEDIGQESVRRSHSLDFRRMKEAQRRRSRENSKKRRSVTSSLYSDGDTPQKKRRSHADEAPPMPVGLNKGKRRRDPPSPLIFSSGTLSNRQAENETEQQITPKIYDQNLGIDVYRTTHVSQVVITGPHVPINEPSVVTLVRKRTLIRPAETAIYRTMPASVDTASLPIVEPEQDDDMAGAAFMLSSAQAHARMQAELLAKVPRYPPVVKLNELTPKASHTVFSQSTLSLNSSGAADDHNSEGWTTPTEGFRTPLARSTNHLPLPNRPFADVPMSVYDSGSAVGSRTNIGRSGLFTAEPTSSSVYEFATPVGSMVQVRESTVSTSTTAESDTSYEPNSTRDSHLTTDNGSRESAASYDTTPGATPDNSSTDPETEGELKDHFDEEGYNNPWLRDRPLPDIPEPLSSASSIYTSESGASASVATDDSQRRSLRSRFDSSRSRISLGIRSMTKSLKSSKTTKPLRPMLSDLPKNDRWFAKKGKKDIAANEKMSRVSSEPNFTASTYDYSKAVVPFMSTAELIPPGVDPQASLTDKPNEILAVVASSSALVLARPPPRLSSLAASRKKPPRTTLLRSTFRSAMAPSAPHLAITDVGYNEAFTEHGQLSEYQLLEAAKLEVIAETGHRVPFGALWMNQRTIVIFIRHFWCPICQDYMYSISKEVDPIMLGRANVQLVVISNGSYKMIKAYRKIFRTPFTLFTNPSLNLYHALGMILATTDGGPESEKGEYVKHGVVSGVAMVVSNAAKARMPIWANGGDIEQLGGEFVFGPGPKISFVHRMKNTRSHAPIADVCLAAGVDIRTTRALNGGRSSFAAIFQNNDDARWREAQRRSLERLQLEQEQGYDEQDDLQEIGGNVGVGHVHQRAEAVEQSVKTVRQTINKLDGIVAEEKARIRSKRNFSKPFYSTREATSSNTSIVDIPVDDPVGNWLDSIPQNAEQEPIDVPSPSISIKAPLFIRRKKNAKPPPPTAFSNPKTKAENLDSDDDTGDDHRRSQDESVTSHRSKQALYRGVKNPFPDLGSDIDTDPPKSSDRHMVSSADESVMVLRLVDGIWKKGPAAVSDEESDISEGPVSEMDEEATQKLKI